MYALWMPYVTFHVRGTRNKRIRIALAELWTDEDDNWRNELGCDRPTWLSCFRGFPQHGESELGEPLRGTLIVSTDEHWLRLHAFRLIGVLYLLGDQGSYGEPAERFKYVEIRIPGGDHDLVKMWTKKGPLTEDADSLAVSPPVELRGRCTPYRLDVTRAEHDTIIDLLETSPHHRLVTACWHYFMAQFGDVFHSPWLQDYARYCSCLEAALDISPFGGNLHKSVANRLEETYCKDLKLQEWAWGLYSVRSAYNHGSESATVPETMKHLVAAQEAFLDRQANSTVVRSVAKDVLLRALATHRGVTPNPWSPDRADSILRACLHSDDCWQSAKKLTQAKGSVQSAAVATGNALEQLEQLLHEFTACFDWQFVVAPPDTKDVWEAIGVLSLAATKVSNGNAKVVDEAEELVAFAGNRRIDEIKDWLNCSRPMKAEYAGGTSLEELLLSLAVEVARFFTQYRSG